MHRLDDFAFEVDRRVVPSAERFHGSAHDPPCALIHLFPSRHITISCDTSARSRIVRHHRNHQ